MAGDAVKVFLAMVVPLAMAFQPALAQDQFSEQALLQSDLHRQLTSMYADTLGRMMASDQLPEDGKIKLVQEHIDMGGRCATQRLWLMQNLTDAVAKEKFRDERMTLLGHYKYFGFALERIDLSTYENLAKQLDQGTPTLLEMVDGIYQRSSNNNSSQVSSELLNFADACNAFVRDAMLMESRAIEALAKQ